MIEKILNYFRPYPHLRPSIINLKSGTSFKGVIWRRTGPWVVIKQAQILHSEGNRPVDGEVLVQMSDIEFVQVI